MVFLPEESDFVPSQCVPFLSMVLDARTFRASMSPVRSVVDSLLSFGDMFGPSVRNPRLLGSRF